MGIFDIFKKSKTQTISKTEKAEVKEKKEKPSQKKEKAKVELKEEKKEVKLSSLKEKKPVFGVLKRPHITEKASLLGAQNQYIFEVYASANKNQIKKAVEGFYNVNVEKVRIINIPSRPRRLGRSQGIKSGFKKAVVTLKKGEKIELIPR